MNIKYQIVKLIFKYFGTKKYYQVTVPNEIEINYLDPNDVALGNETTYILNNSPRKFFEWFNGKLLEIDFEDKVILDLGC